MSPRLRMAGVFALTGLAVTLAGYALFGLTPQPLPRPGRAARTPPAPPGSGGAGTEPAPRAQPVSAPSQAPAGPTAGLLPPPRPYRLEDADAPGADSPEPLTAGQLFDRTRDSVVCVTAERPSGSAAVTGVLFGTTGHVLTAAAPIRQAEAVFVSLPTGGTIPATLVLVDAALGVAVLRVQTAAEWHPPALNLGAALEAEMSVVGLLCMPGLGVVAKPMRSAGSAPEEADGTVVALDGPLPAGGEGAPLFDRTGRLAGLVVGTGGDAAPAQAIGLRRLADRLVTDRPGTPVFGLTGPEYVTLGAHRSDPEAAMWAFRMALVADPGALVPTYNLGVAAAQTPMGRATAAAAFRHVIRLDVSFADAYFNLALLSLAAGDTGAAVGLLENCTVLEPEVASVWLALGEAYRRAGAVAQAEDALRRALRLNPLLPEAHFNLGVLYATGLDRPAAARAAFLRYAQVAPASPHARAAVTYARAAQARARGAPSGNLPRATPAPDNAGAEDNARGGDTGNSDGPAG